MDGAVEVHGSTFELLTQAGAAVTFALEADDDLAELATETLSARGFLHGIFRHHRGGPTAARRMGMGRMR